MRKKINLVGDTFTHLTNGNKGYSVHGKESKYIEWVKNGGDATFYLDDTINDGVQDNREGTKYLWLLESKYIKPRLVESILDNRQIVEDTYDIIFTHDPFDVNNDHKIIYRSTIMSTRPNSGSNVPTILTYEVPSSSECGFSQEGQFSPNYFIELSKFDLQKKFETLSYYSSEINSFPFPRSYEGIKTYARFRGMQAAVEYAEAFKLIRSISYVS